MTQESAWQEYSIGRAKPVEGLTVDARLSRAQESRDIHRAKAEGRKRLRQWYNQSQIRRSAVLDHHGDPI